MLGLGLNLLSSVCARAMATPGSLASTLNLDFKSMTTLPSTITFSRPSNATYYDSTGKLTYAPNNIALYSEQFNSGVWIPGNTTITANTTVSPDGTLTADTLTSGAAATVHNIYQNNPYATTTGSYVQSLYVKKGTHRYVFISHGSGASAYATAIFDLDDGGTSATQTGTLNSGVIVSTKKESVGNGWFRLTLVASGMTSRYFQFGFANAATGNAFNIDGSPLSTTTGTETFHIWGAQFEQVTYQTTPGTYVATTTAAYYGARLDYNPATLAARGLLIEEARTNLQTNSSRLSGWTMFAGTVTLDSLTSPDGTVNAASVLETTANSVHQFYSGPTFTSVIGTTYTFSIFAKANGRTRCQINPQSTMLVPVPEAFYDLSTETVDNVGAGVTASIQSVGNGWYRLTFTFTANAATTSGNFYVNLVSTGTTKSYPGNASLGMYFYGGQFETGSFATSYIPTAASSVARSADTASMTGANFSSWYNQTEGTFVANSETGGVTSAAMAGQATVAAFTPSIDVARYQSGTIGANIFNGTLQSQLTLSPSFVFGQIYKTAHAYKLNDVAGVANGGTVQTDTSATIPTLDRLFIGYTDNNYQLNGHLASLVYYPQRLPNATLQSLTS